MKIFIAIMLLATMNSCSLYYGCNKNNDLVRLSEDIRRWIPYSQSDEVIFENGSTDTMVKVLEYTESIEAYDRGDECPPGSKEEIFTKLVSALFNDTIKVRLTRGTLNIENQNFQLTYVEGGEIVYPPNDITKKYHQTFTVNQKVFNEVLVSTCTACSELSEIVFSKSDGLAAFKFNDVYWIRK